MKTLLIGLFVGCFGFMMGIDVQQKVMASKTEREQWICQSERIAREGKTDREWYESHPQAMGESHPVPKGMK